MHILYIAISYLQLILHSAFYFFALKERKLKSYQIWLIIILKDLLFAFLANCVPAFSTLMPGLPFSLPYRTALAFFLELMIVFFLFKDNFKTKLLVFVFNWIILLGTDALSSAVFTLLTGKNFTEIRTSISMESLVSAMIFIALQAFLTFLFYGFLSLQRKEHRLTNFVPSFLLIFIQLLLFCTSIYQPERAFTKSFVIFLFVELLICVLSDIYLIAIAPPKIAENKNLQERLRYIEEIRNGENAFFTSLLTKEQEMAELRHDWNNLLQIAMTQSKDNGTSDADTNLLEALSRRVDATKLTRYCSNQTINALLNAKMNNLKENNIPVSISCSLPEETKIDELDLCSIFSNLIDNASEYCTAHPSPKNSIAISCKNLSSENILIQIKNYAHSPQMFIKTTKADTRRHGYGLGIVRNIVSKYKGTFELTNDKNMVVASVLLVTE